MIDNLGDAISHAREVAEKLTEKAKLMREGSKNGLFYPKDFEDCETCASDHEQLADWLTELADRREADKELEEMAGRLKDSLFGDGIRFALKVISEMRKHDSGSEDK